MSLSDLTARFKAEALRLGFDKVGIAPAVTPPGYSHFLDWLAAGHGAGMSYLERNAGVREHPARLLGGAKSVVMTSLVYGQKQTLVPGRTEGKVARYARGSDYHEVLWRKLETLLGWLIEQAPGTTGRALADTAPLLERDFARLAGLGWIGKNTMLIDRRLGSFTVLGALILDLELEFDPPHESNHCGTCTRCLDACPTDAFAGPYSLDASRCISYWTIEHKGPIDEANADKLDGWVFGCDICQDVCPWNRKAPPGRTAELDPRPGLTTPDLIDWLTRNPIPGLKGTALTRSKRAGLQRNAALILGTRRVVEARSALLALQDDPDEGVRRAVEWALNRIAGD